MSLPAFLRVLVTLQADEAIVSFCETPEPVYGDLSARLPDDGSEHIDTSGARWSKLRIAVDPRTGNAHVRLAEVQLDTAALMDGEAQRLVLRRVLGHVAIAIAKSRDLALLTPTDPMPIVSTLPPPPGEVRR